MPSIMPDLVPFCVMLQSSAENRSAVPGPIQLAKVKVGYIDSTRTSENAVRGGCINNHNDATRISALSHDDKSNGHLRNKSLVQRHQGWKIR
jgi:hypothetical protein